MAYSQSTTLPTKRPPLTTEQVIEARQLYWEQGWSARAVAEHFDRIAYSYRDRSPIAPNHFYDMLNGLAFQSIPLPPAALVYQKHREQSPTLQRIPRLTDDQVRHARSLYWRCQLPASFIGEQVGVMPHRTPAMLGRAAPVWFYDMLNGKSFRWIEMPV